MWGADQITRAGGTWGGGGRIRSAVCGASGERNQISGAGSSRAAHRGRVTSISVTPFCLPAPRLAAAPRHGLAPSSAGYGPLRDLPDWSFVDGRPAPPWKGQTRRRQEDKAFAQRVALLAQEMEQGLRHWQDEQHQAQEMRDSKRQNQLQPKGGILRGPHTQ
uniref:Large ribosomal subunit protein mL52 n=1 Tax=Pelusios castaneus TaxID=367368 RepID=A0A8C8RR44_9SAUR